MPQEGPHPPNPQDELAKFVESTWSSENGARFSRIALNFVGPPKKVRRMYVATRYARVREGQGQQNGNITGSNNTANGYQALFSNTTGISNSAFGGSALFSNTSGSHNIAVGLGAGRNLTIGNWNIDIGSPGVAGEVTTIRIGSERQTRAFIAGISGVALTGSTIVVDASGQLGVAASSKRFKEAIKPMDKTSEALFSLNPVAFRYNKEIDPERKRQFGLVAEEVEKVDADLVVRDQEGRPFTVRYDQVNAMLLNEFLKEHGKVEKLETIVPRQQKQIEALTIGLQKVSAQLELSKTAPQTVLNNH